MISDLILKANEFLINDSCNNIDNEYKFELINVKHSSSIIKLISSSDDFNSLIKDPTNQKDDQLNIISKISEN